MTLSVYQWQCQYVNESVSMSKADIAAGAASAASLSNSTNDIVINKLTQILSYLRAGKNFYIFYKEIKFSTSYI